MTATPTPRQQRWTCILDGGRLQQVRRQRLLSQEQLAALAGISLTTIRRLEHRPAAPCRSRTLARLAAALDKEPACLTTARQSCRGITSMNGVPPGPACQSQ